MLQTQGLDPFTQSAAYYRLTGDAPKANTVEVSVQNASRDAVYAPASMEKVTDGDVHERRYALLKGRGLFGTRNYTVTEVSGTRPSVKPGEYERVNGLLEKTIYGGIPLEPFEERALDLFVQRALGKKCEEKLENAP